MNAKKTAKMVGLTVGALLVLLLVGGLLFITISPEFGGRPTPDQKQQYRQSGHYTDGEFVNLVFTSMDMSLGTMLSVLGDYLRGTPDGKPSTPLPVEKIDSAAIANRAATVTQLTWFGHSAVLLEMDGKNILLDPMLGEVPAPHPWLGGNRFSAELPITIEQLPAIDVVLISHDHYDHLDYGSIKKLKEKVKDFYVPLGVGAHLRAWGVDKAAVHELDWWEEMSHDHLQLVFTPSRHFSGRGLTDRNTTLWGSWVIQGRQDTLYFSGDGGYGPHFAEIGERYGPFDLAMMECGQYDERWAQIHMMPEETAQAAVDLRAQLMMPIHWGAFQLALHAWTDPAERVTVKAKELDLPVTTPKIGQAVVLRQTIYSSTTWWKN